MPVTIESLQFLPASSHASSSDSGTTEPQLIVTLSGIDNKVLDVKNHVSRHHALCIAHPNLTSHMRLAAVKVVKESAGDDKLEPEDGRIRDSGYQAPRQLKLTYAGKGSIRALLRSLLDMSDPSFEVSVDAVAHAKALLNQLSRSPSPAASSVDERYLPHSASSHDAISLPDISTVSFARPVYRPGAFVWAMHQGINAVERCMIADKPYIVAAYPGARRRLSDLIASVAEVTHRLSEGRSPRSTVFQDDNGSRRAVGSDFKSQAITLHDKLLSLAPEARASYVRAHARDLGECLALMIYIDQADFHLKNIMVDTVTDRWFILDFDKCYNTQTHKYHGTPVTSHDFSQMSQCDLRSPLNPVDRMTENWFCLQQAHLSQNQMSHTITKLQALPGLDTLVETEEFKLAYFTSLYACASLGPAQIQTCTQQIMNATVREQMVRDFSDRSAQLRLQLLSMPEFVVCYQEHAAVFQARIAALGQDGMIAPASQILEQFNQEVNQAMIAKVTSLEAVVHNLQKELTQTKVDYESAILKSNKRERALAMIENQYDRAHLYRCAELELKGIDALTQWLVQQDPRPEGMLMKLNGYKKDIIQYFNELTCLMETTPTSTSSCTSSSAPSLETALIEMPDVTHAKKRMMRGMARYCLETITAFKIKLEQQPLLTNKLALLNKHLQRLKQAWERYFPSLCLLEARQDPYLVELTQQLTEASAAYCQIIYDIQQMGITAASSATTWQAKREARLQLEQLLPLLDLLVNAGVLNVLDRKRARHVLQAQIDQMLASEREFRYHSEFMTFYHNIDARLRDVSPADLSQTITPQDCINHLSRLIPSLQGFRDEESVEARSTGGQQLNAYATQTRNYPLATFCLAVADHLLDYIAAHPLTVPAAPPTYDLPSLESYSRQYQAIENENRTRLGWVRQLTSYYQQLASLAWITPEDLAERTSRIDALRSSYQRIETDYQTRNTEARDKLTRFSTAYRSAEHWYTGLSLFGQRPDNMEQQHTVYQHWVAGHLSPWAAWVGVHGIGHQAALQEGVISQALSFFGASLRDAQTQTYYHSFPTEPSDGWTFQ